MKRLAGSILFCVWAIFPLSGTVEAASHGLSEQGLDHVRRVIRDEVESGQVPSAVGLVARDGEVVFLEAIGRAGIDRQVRADTIMRMASITKAVTAVAVMILYEDGSLLLDDEVVEYIGAFASARVRRAESATGSPDLTEPKTSPTIRHLLTHTAGLARRGKAVNELWGGAATVREFAEGIARIPLRHDPGAGYAYGNAYEVLAAVVESASGERFDRFVQKRILDPLRMTDTHFFVPESKRNRLSAMYTRDEEGGLVYFREPGQEESPSKYFSGGGGLRSTILDFYRFAQMLLNEGTLDGVRVLSPKTVRLMTRDHVGEEVPAAWEGDWGWGFGFAVRRRVLDGEVGTAGSYGWNGGTGTWFFVDPKERLVGLIFTQMNPGNPHDLRERFERSVYFAVDESYAESEDG